MQLSSNVKKHMQWKTISCRSPCSNGFECIAACGGCRGTECQNCVTVEEESNIEDEFDVLVNNISSLFIVFSVLM